MYGSTAYGLSDVFYTDGTDIAPYVNPSGKLIVGGDQYGDAVFWGAGSQLESDAYHDDTFNVQYDFAVRMLPSQFTYQKIRLAPTTGASEEKVARYADGTTMRWDTSISSNRDDMSKSMVMTDADGKYIQHGEDVFVPVVWKAYPEMYHYLNSGTARDWFSRKAGMMLRVLMFIA